jgi:hypothetical protein
VTTPQQSSHTGHFESDGLRTFLILSLDGLLAVHCPHILSRASRPLSVISLRICAPPSLSVHFPRREWLLDEELEKQRYRNRELEASVGDARTSEIRLQEDVLDKGNKIEDHRAPLHHDSRRCVVGTPCPLLSIDLSIRSTLLPTNR